MLSNLLQQEFWLLQLPFWTTIAGIIFISLSWSKPNPKHLKWGLLALMSSAVLAIPLYSIGQQIIMTMQEVGESTSAIKQYETDYYITLTLYLFMSITALMCWLIRKSLNYLPKFFLVLLQLYGIIVVLYTGWRQWMMY